MLCENVSAVMALKEFLKFEVSKIGAQIVLLQTYRLLSVLSTVLCRLRLY